MDITIADLIKVSEEKQAKMKSIVEHIRKHGNYSETLEDERNLHRMLKLSPSINPCKVCGITREKGNLESCSLAQVVIFKARDHSEKNLRYIIAPFRHISNEEFIMSQLFGMVGKLASTMKALLNSKYGDIRKFVLTMDNTYGTQFEEMGEHGHLVLKFFRGKEEK